MFRSHRSKAKEILDQHKEPKDEDYDFERIKLLFLNQDHTGCHQVISERTCRDLDFEELFMRADRTCSRVGQQYLYSSIRTIPKTRKRAQRLEKIISYLEANPKVRDEMIPVLNELNDHGAYFIQRLIHGTNLDKPQWFWVIPALSGFSIATLILIFFYPVYPLFILIVAVNFVIHFWNKNNILSYSNTIPQLMKLKKAGRKLLGKQEILEDEKEFEESFSAINQITNTAKFLSWESRASGELGQIAEYFFELIKGAFLLEPILIFKIIGKLDTRKKEIEVLFRSVAKVDVAISIASFRESLPYYCKPSFSDKDRKISGKVLFHPLIPDPVANSWEQKEGKSVLISGSNMSGKTTFIRTMGINVILAETINTACAEAFKLPLLKVHSAIRISDDLLDETSYYYEEVKIIREMIAESETNDQNLFLLDELFKGTNTIERVASAKAVLSFLNQKSNIVFASTHDLELTDYLQDSYAFYHFEEQVEEEKLTFDFKLKSGKWTHTNAIRILEINGFPAKLTKEAMSIAKKLREKKA